MRIVCLQFQPHRARALEAEVRQALLETLPFAQVTTGVDRGRYENFIFHAASPKLAIWMLRAVLESPDIGHAARSSCIVTCEGQQGWDDYLLLHHFDRTQILYVPS